MKQRQKGRERRRGKEKRRGRRDGEERQGQVWRKCLQELRRGWEWAPASEPELALQPRGSPPLHMQSPFPSNPFEAALGSRLNQGAHPGSLPGQS